jgi:2Fe-2S ferredoxin
MAKILFIEHSGKQHSIDAEIGKTLMQNAVDKMLPGIIGDCGGACSCATCHCYIDGDWAAKVDTKTDAEDAMLDGALHTQAGSRLTCQIMMTEALDGLVVRLPVSQF